MSANITTDYAKVAETIHASFSPGKLDQYMYEGVSSDVKLQLYTNRIKQFVDANAVILEVNDYNAVAVWEPATNFVYPELILNPVNERVEEYKEKVHHLLEKHGFGDDVPQWVLSFIGKDPNVNKGSITPLVKPYLEKTVQEGFPATLIAVSDHAKSVYEHWGFEYLDKDYLGVGVVNANGEKDVNGEGLPIYLMAYNYK